MITTTWSKDKTVVNADADGKWIAKVQTPVAGGPYEITFNDGEKLTLKNVLIGEVWICSGQSNMEMPMKGFNAQPVQGATGLILAAQPSTLIRSCNVEKVKSFDLQEECPAKWYENTPEGVAEAMHWLREDIDGVIYVLDSTQDPFMHVNIMMIGIIESRKLPVIIVANKIDLPDAAPQRIKSAFPQHPVVEISGLEGNNMDALYSKIAEVFR